MKKIITLILLSLLIGSVYSQGYKVGDRAMGFDLINIDGTMVSNNDYSEAKGFIVIFTCNHCPFSVAYEDRIIDMDKSYKSMGYPVIAINSNDSLIAPTDSYSHMKIRAQEKGFTFPYLLDTDQSVAKTYGATRTPHVFILKKEKKKLVVKYIGAIDDNHEEPNKVTVNYVDNAVKALLNNKKPAQDFTKAIGCSIKFSK